MARSSNSRTIYLYIIDNSKKLRDIPLLTIPNPNNEPSKSFSDFPIFGDFNIFKEFETKADRELLHYLEEIKNSNALSQTRNNSQQLVPGNNFINFPKPPEKFVSYDRFTTPSKSKMNPLSKEEDKALQLAMAPITVAVRQSFSKVRVNPDKWAYFKAKAVENFKRDLDKQFQSSDENIDS